MDDIKTGVFEISTACNDFLQDWQVELAKEELKRRARTAIERVQRDGVPYVTCLYPIEKKDGKLVLDGFCLVSHWRSCEVGEACFYDDCFSDATVSYADRAMLKIRDSEIIFEHNSFPFRGFPIYIYRRVQ